MNFTWDIDLSTIIAIAMLIISQYAMHKKNLETLAGIKLKVGLMWSVFARDHGINENGE